MIVFSIWCRLMPLGLMVLCRKSDVSAAWVLWSGAAEGAFADAYCSAGGLFPDWGLVSDCGVARFRTVRLGGPKVRLVVMLLIPLMGVMILVP